MPGGACHATPLARPATGRAREFSNFDSLSNLQNEQFVSPEMTSSGILINSTSHSMANRNTFHADSSDSHLFEQSSHAGHVDHENQQIFITKTAGCEHSHYSTSHSIANSGTFHADSSDGHRIK